MPQLKELTIKGSNELTLGTVEHDNLEPQHNLRQLVLDPAVCNPQIGKLRKIGGGHCGKSGQVPAYYKAFYR